MENGGPCPWPGLQAEKVTASEAAQEDRTRPPSEANLLLAEGETQAQGNMVS